jgi:hypothetical protein
VGSAGADGCTVRAWSIALDRIDDTRKALDHDAGFRPPAPATSPGGRHHGRRRGCARGAGCGAHPPTAKLRGASASVRCAADGLHAGRRRCHGGAGVDGRGEPTGYARRDRERRDDRAEHAPDQDAALSAVLPRLRHVQQVRDHGRRRVRLPPGRDLQQGRGHGQRPSTAVDGPLTSRPAARAAQGWGRRAV